LKESHYENLEYEGEENDFYYVMAYTKMGVVCLLSAAVYYGLTNYRPDSIDVAIPKNKNITTLSECPILNLYYFDDYRYDFGISLVEEGKNQFQIFDIEKTVIDIVYYRNKIGIDETKEILTNYLLRSDRNINQLIRYSKMLKCYDILNMYLEVLI
jgi:predicted transcriptional regulator of viral defense system